MSIHSYHYMIVSNPPKAQGDPRGQADGHHVRLVPSSVVGQEALVERMHQRENVLSRGTCETAIAALACTLGELLADGHVVHIPGVGTMQPRLSGSVGRDAHGLASADVHVGNILFTPDPELLARANEGRPHLARRGPAALPSTDELRAFLDDHFAHHDRLTRKPLADHFHLNKDQALKLLRRLVGEGVLAARGSRATAHYVMLLV